MNNSVFGKTMENIRNRVDIRLSTNPKQMDKLVTKPNFKDRTIFTNSLVAVHIIKTKLCFNKPICVGMCILDLSKVLMYDFHNNIMKPKYGKKIELCYQDTDSYIYYIKTSDLYSDMKEMVDNFDTSDYKKDNPYGIPLVNKKIIGKMKDKCNGKIMETLPIVCIWRKIYLVSPPNILLTKRYLKRDKKYFCPSTKDFWNQPRMDHERPLRTAEKYRALPMQAKAASRRSSLFDSEHAWAPRWDLPGAETGNQPVMGGTCVDCEKHDSSSLCSRSCGVP
ncbi:hypothetical protein PR048_023880 [Dryococelus australis]|uniref:Uncharacterized protein n=1 Tax=Dryococelus australis TaxID=614101 RepID=A0ABQ9GVC7_9NEOP|nr:hypothetical protein PR048_023880 [Dryococelus australis]